MTHLKRLGAMLVRIPLWAIVALLFVNLGITLLALQPDLTTLELVYVLAIVVTLGLLATLIELANDHTIKTLEETHALALTLAQSRNILNEFAVEVVTIAGEALGELYPYDYEKAAELTTRLSAASKKGHYDHTWMLKGD